MLIIKADKDLINGIDFPDEIEFIYLGYYNDNRDDLKDVENKDVKELINYLEKEKVEIAGYGYMNFDSANEIEIFVKEDYRGSLCGEELFERILKDCNKERLSFNVALENYPMIRILEKHNAINLGTNNGIVKYVMKKD
jgi:GNAT superfamily N-acetyltransferase